MPSLLRDVLLVMLLSLVAALTMALSAAYIEIGGELAEGGEGLAMASYLTLLLVPFLMVVLFSDHFSHDYVEPTGYGAAAVWYLAEYVNYSSHPELPAAMNESMKEMSLTFVAVTLLLAVITTPRVLNSLGRRLEASEVFN